VLVDELMAVCEYGGVLALSCPVREEMLTWSDNDDEREEHDDGRYTGR
jgi:hypothetical protein